MSQETRKIGSYILFANDKNEKRIVADHVIQIVKSIKALPLKSNIGVNYRKPLLLFFFMTAFFTS